MSPLPFVHQEVRSKLPASCPLWPSPAHMLLVSPPALPSQAAGWCPSVWLRDAGPPSHRSLGSAPPALGPRIPGRLLFPASVQTATTWDSRPLWGGRVGGSRLGGCLPGFPAAGMQPRGGEKPVGLQGRWWEGWGRAALKSGWGRGLRPSCHCHVTPTRLLPYGPWSAAEGGSGSHPGTRAPPRLLVLGVAVPGLLVTAPEAGPCLSIS